MLLWRCTNPKCKRICTYDELRGISVKRGGEAKQGKEKYHSEAMAGNYEPYEPQKKSRRAPKIIGITIASILAVVIFIAINPFSPSLTKETLAIRETVCGNTNNVKIYYNKQPHYSKGSLYTNINLVNSQSATDPTWQQLLQFIVADDTDEQTYIQGIYMCGSFAETLHNNAEQEGIRAAWVAIYFADSSEAHALNAFYTVDQGAVFVDCTGGGFEVISPSFGDSDSHDVGYDKLAYVKVGEEYGSISADVARSPQYTFYEQYKQQWEEFERRLEDYNKRLEQYNQETSGEVYYEGSSEYYRIMTIYNELKQEEEELDQVCQELGYSYWEPLGVISHVEIYW
jgi:hypothetical protein